MLRRTPLIFLILLIVGLAAGARAQFHSGEIVSFGPYDYPPGVPITAELTVRNTGVAGFLNVECITPPPGWTVTPIKHTPAVVPHNQTYTFNFQINPHPEAGTAVRNITFRLYVYENDQFEVTADTETFEVRSLENPMGFNMLSPTAGQENVFQPIDFVWEVSPLAADYVLEIYAEEGTNPLPEPFFTRVTTETQTRVSVEDFELPPGFLLFWRVRARNAVGEIYANGEHRAFFMGLPPPPEPFQWITPSAPNQILPPQPLFHWTHSQGAKVYLFEIFPDVDGLPGDPVTRRIVLDATLPDSNVVQIVSPLETGKYWVLVAAFNEGSGLQVTGGVRPFSVSTLGAFSQTTPASNATDQSDRPFFQWTASSSAQSYRLEVFHEKASGAWVPTIDVTIPNGGTSFQYQGDPLGRGTPYVWRVTAFSGTTPPDVRVASNTPQRFVTRATLPFGVREPWIDATDVARAPLFRWHRVPGAASFVVEVAPSDQGVPDTTELVTSPALGGGTTTWQWPGIPLDANRDYLWRVLAYPAGSSTAEVNREGWVPFRTSRLGGFALVSPANGAESVGFQPTLVWEPVPLAQSYRVWIATTGAGGSTLPPIVSDGNLLVVPSSSALSGSTEYIWSVEALTDTDSQWANAPFTFTTVPRNIAVYADLLETLLGRRILGANERASLGLGPDELVGVDDLIPIP